MDTPESAPREFRLFLQQELSRRCKKNPYFSLRAFARTLDVEVSSLSKILNGKRSLSKNMLHRISSQLGLPPDRVSYYEGKLQLRKQSKKKIEFTQLTLDTFTVISDWYHYAILELVTVESFKSNRAWIAKTLGITVSEVNFAVERLQRLGMLSINGEDWRQCSGHLTTIGSNFAESALQKLQSQILHQAQESLHLTKIEKRDQSAMTMSIDSNKITEAKQRIKQFRREMCEFLQSSTQKDEVYQLSISLFPVSKAKK